MRELVVASRNRGKLKEITAQNVETVDPDITLKECFEK